MKTSKDPRHQNRINIMQLLFSYSFGNLLPDGSISEIIPHLAVIDQKIGQAAPEWPTDKISKIDLAILRLAVYELTVQKIHPLKVIIDEAIELAKEFGNQKSPQFVNGVLGTIVKKPE